MKKDIVAPESKKVNLFLVPLDDNAWDMYLVNENELGIKDLLVVTEAYDGEVKSSTLRYYLEKLDTLSGIKFETIFMDVMKLKNSVNITYYKGAEFYHKEFKFSYSEIEKMNLTHHFIVQKDGYLFT